MHVSGATHGHISLTHVCVLPFTTTHALQVALLLAVPFMGSPLRVKRSLCFNMNTADSVVATNPPSSIPVDTIQQADAARREIIKHGITSTVCLGSATAMVVHERLM
jgi:hypothetical protein